MKTEIIKAPTGFGKTANALERAKNEKIVLAVPTVKIADEVYQRAKDLGISAIQIIGRSNYICGYKAKKDGIDINELISDRIDDWRLKQDIGCCLRKECNYDPFKAKKERIIEENPNLIITTHAFLKSSSFKEVFDFNRVLIIDEIHSFIRSLKEPSEESRLSLRDLVTLGELIKTEIPEVKSSAESFVDEIQGIIKKTPSKKVIIKILDKNGNEKIFEDIKEDYNRAMDILDKAGKKIFSLRNMIKPKSKDVKKISIRERLTLILETISRIKKAGTPGMYIYFNSTNYDIQIGIKQVLFSTAMWQIFNRIINNLQPKEIVGMSATISESLSKKLFSSVKFSFEYKEEFHKFKNSLLDMVIFDMKYDPLKRTEDLEYIAKRIKELKRDKGMVILATNFKEMGTLRNILSNTFKVAMQEYENKSDEIIKIYENGEVDIIIGNRSFWEGINIKRDSDFVIVKMPYFYPEDVDYIAIEEYSNRNSYPINKAEAEITLIQGLGRIIRNNNEHKRVYIFDNRIRDFGIPIGRKFETKEDYEAILDDIPVSVRITKIPIDAEITEEVLNAETTNYKDIYYHSYKAFQNRLLAGGKLNEKEWFSISIDKLEKDEEYAKKENIQFPFTDHKKVYGALLKELVMDFIALQLELGIKIDKNYIEQATGVSHTYINEILKEIEVKLDKNFIEKTISKFLKELGLTKK